MDLLTIAEMSGYSPIQTDDDSIIFEIGKFVVSDYPGHGSARCGISRIDNAWCFTFELANIYKVNLDNSTELHNLMCACTESFGTATLINAAGHPDTSRIVWSVEDVMHPMISDNQIIPTLTGAFVFNMPIENLFHQAMLLILNTTQTFNAGVKPCFT